MPCPLPGDLPDPGIKPTSLESPALAGGFFTTSATWAGLGKRKEKAESWLQKTLPALPRQTLQASLQCWLFFFFFFKEEIRTHNSDCLENPRSSHPSPQTRKSWLNGGAGTLGGRVGKGEGCRGGPGLSMASDMLGAQQCLRGWGRWARLHPQRAEGTPPGISGTASSPIPLAVASEPGCVQGRLCSTLDPGIPAPDLRMCFSWLSDPTKEHLPWLWSPRPLCEGRWLRCCYFFTFIRDRWHVSPWRTPRWT